MRRIGTSLAAAALAMLASTGAMAQSYPEADAGCRQYAWSIVAPLQNQNTGQQVGSTLLGAGLGAALGAAVGGGRGAAIGAASGAVVGTGVGAANAQNNQAYIQQQYGAYYWQCMSARGFPPGGYGPPPGSGYGPR